MLKSEKMVFTLGKEFPEGLDGTHVCYQSISEKNVSIYREEKVSVIDILASMDKAYKIEDVKQEKKESKAFCIVDLYNDALLFIKLGNFIEIKEDTPSKLTLFASVSNTLDSFTPSFVIFIMNNLLCILFSWSEPSNHFVH